MRTAKKTRIGRLAAAGLVIAAVAAAFAMAPALAQDRTDMSPEQLQQLWEYLRNTPVSEQSCQFCHKNLAETKNFSGEIIFTHGYHLKMECSSCHSKFPHGEQGAIVQLPTMKLCWNCHGLKHGPMGELASGKCEDCHKTRQDRLRPAFHTWDWAQKPHVVPGEKELQTKCMMCHDAAWCDDCHEEQFIDWKPEKPYVYDPGDGCYVSCHGSVNLLKLSGEDSRSFQVSGLELSAHQDLTCVQCHADFKYEEGPDVTKVWTVNAGLACQNCHDHDSQAAEYSDSIHSAALMKGNYESATCGSCHGGHDIQRLDTAEASAALHGSAVRMCARCHPDQYASYDDYYHGAAYKRGAPDAPACWQCHGAHDVLPSGDPSSAVSPQNVADTCGACHEGSGESFGANAKELIHQKIEARRSNPLLQFISKVRSWVS